MPVKRLLTVLGYIIRTWLFWMSGAFSLLLTVYGLYRAASGLPASPSQTLEILGGLGIVAFVISGGTAWWHERAQVRALTAQLAALGNQETKKSKVRNDLAVFMFDGQALQQQLASSDEPLEALEPAFDAWAAKIEQWLGENLEASYIVRFRNGAGIPMGAFVMRRSLNTKEGPLNGFIRVRLTRLGEFMAEYS